MSQFAVIVDDDDDNKSSGPSPLLLLVTDAEAAAEAEALEDDDDEGDENNNDDNDDGFVRIFILPLATILGAYDDRGVGVVVMNALQDEKMGNRAAAAAARRIHDGDDDDLNVIIGKQPIFLLVNVAMIVEISAV